MVTRGVPVIGRHPLPERRWHLRLRRRCHRRSLPTGPWRCGAGRAGSGRGRSDQIRSGTVALALALGTEVPARRPAVPARWPGAGARHHTEGRPERTTRACRYRRTRAGERPPGAGGALPGRRPYGRRTHRQCTATRSPPLGMPIGNMPQCRAAGRGSALPACESAPPAGTDGDHHGEQPFSCPLTAAATFAFDEPVLVTFEKW